MSTFVYVKKMARSVSEALKSSVGAMSDEAATRQNWGWRSVNLLVDFVFRFLHLSIERQVGEVERLAY
jgi:hypothetical protein